MMRAADKMAWVGAVGLALALVVACAVTPVRPDGTPETVVLDDYLAQGARTMWIAPHPDDELFAGPILARSARFHGNPLYFLVLTHGEGGACGLARGCEPDLATVRGREMTRAAAHYGAELQHAHFYNAPLPVESFPEPEELRRTWFEQGDPVRLIAEAVRRFRPDLVLTFDPHHGATGHPEHRLTARLTSEALRLAADPQVAIGGLEPHRVGRIYQLVNRYWPLVLFGLADPGPVTEQFDATLPCTPELSCLEFMLHGIRLHRTQHADMQQVVEFQGAFETLDLRQIDPYAASAD